MTQKYGLVHQPEACIENSTSNAKEFKHVALNPQSPSSSGVHYYPTTSRCLVGSSSERTSTCRSNEENLPIKANSSNHPLLSKGVTRTSNRCIRSAPGMAVQVPRKSDILFGRGGGTNFHPGNMEYRRKIKMKQKDYIDARQRSTKSEIIAEIIREVQAEGGRFLKQDESSKLWYEVDEKEVKKKTSQTLREGAPQWRKDHGEWKRREEELKYGNGCHTYMSTMDLMHSEHGTPDMGVLDGRFDGNQVATMVPPEISSLFQPSMQKKPTNILGDESEKKNGLDLLSDVALHSTQETSHPIPPASISMSSTVDSANEGKD